MYGEWGHFIIAKESKRSCVGQGSVCRRLGVDRWVQVCRTTPVREGGGGLREEVIPSPDPHRKGGGT